MVAQHTEMALAVARETGWRLDEGAEEHEWSAVGLGPVGQHRDSDALERSNFSVIYADLSSKFPASVDVARFGHWAVGWVEEIIWDAGDDAVVQAVERWRDALESYPVAEEEDYSRLEYEEAIEWIGQGMRTWFADADGVAFELRDELPDDWQEQVFSWLFEDRSACRADDIGDDDMREAGVALGFLAREGAVK